MQAIRVCARRDIDELCLIDILATEQNRKPDFTKLREYASEISCPLMVGGGIKTAVDAISAINNGADKILLRKGSSVHDVSSAIGSSSVAYNLVYDGIDDFMSLHRRILFLSQDVGAGEIILTDRKRDGTMSGYNLAHIKLASEASKVPIVANSGCGTPNDMHQALVNGADAVMAGSMFLFTETTPKQAAKFLHDKGHEVRV